MDQPSAFEGNVLFSLPRACFASWVSVRVCELSSLLVPQGWKYIRRTGGTSGLLVRGTRPELGLERQDTQKGAQGTQYRHGQCKLLSLAIIIACTQNHCCHRDLETGG